MGSPKSGGSSGICHLLMSGGWICFSWSGRKQWGCRDVATNTDHCLHPSLPLLYWLLIPWLWSPFIPVNYCGENPLAHNLQWTFQILMWNHDLFRLQSLRNCNAVLFGPRTNFMGTEIKIGCVLFVPGQDLGKNHPFCIVFSIGRLFRGVGRTGGMSYCSTSPDQDFGVHQCLSPSFSENQSSQGSVSFQNDTMTL